LAGLGGREGRGIVGRRGLVVFVGGAYGLGGVAGRGVVPVRGFACRGVDRLDRLDAHGLLGFRIGLSDRVGGLNAGADDYLLKPFDMEELVARLRALLRRPGSALGSTLTSGNLSMDTVAREAAIGGQAITLSRKELGLLELLMRRAGRVVPKDAIEESLYSFDELASQNSIEVLVHRLRRKLGDAGADRQIHTLRGVGYLFSDKAA